MGDYGPGRHTELSVRPRSHADRERERKRAEAAERKRAEVYKLQQEYSHQRFLCEFHCSNCGGTKYAEKEETPLTEPDIYLCECGEVIEHQIHWCNHDKKWDHLKNPTGIHYHEVIPELDLKPYGGR